MVAPPVSIWETSPSKPMLDIPKLMPAAKATRRNTTARATYHGLAVEDSFGLLDIL